MPSTDAPLVVDSPGLLDADARGGDLHRASRGNRAPHGVREESTSEAVVGILHELAELLNLLSGLVQLATAGLGLATALALRRRVRDSRPGDGPGTNRDDDLPG